MFDLKHYKEYKEFLENKLEQISNIDEKLAYVEKELFYVEVDDCWDDKDRAEHCALIDKVKELRTIKNKENENEKHNT